MQNVSADSANAQGLPLSELPTYGRASNLGSDTVGTERGGACAPVLWGCEGFEK